MKKIVVLIATFCALFTLSCNRDSFESELPSVEGMKIVSISASVAKESTKTSYTNTGVFSWAAGDEISVACTDGNFYTFSATKSGSTTKFVGYIPDGTDVGTRAYFPADPNHTLSRFSVTKEKDMTGHDSADLPMVGTGTKIDTDYKFSFSHCSGGALLTVENIPTSIKTVEISIENASLNLSGLFSLSQISETDNYYWSPESKGGGNEFFIRKVNVSGNTAKVFLPYSCHPEWGNMYAASTINVTGYDKDDNATSLITGKSMKALGSFSRAEVKPLTPLVYSDLGKIEWPTSGLFSGSGRVIKWYATSDSRFVYVYMEYDRVDAVTSNTGNYLEVGFDLDNNQSNGETGGYISNIEAWVRLYPITAYSDGVFTFGVKNSGTDSIIQCPIGTKTGAPEHFGEDKSTYLTAEIAIDRTKIGSPASKSIIGIRVSSRSNVTDFQTITLN